MFSTGFGDLDSLRRTTTMMAATFTATSFHGGCAWETFGSAGFLLLRFANPRTTATQSFGDD
ncbi:hypothetical protein C1893_03645 [Pseudomonas sp. MPR-ANC1]|nr:hypothetical protein C1893_03645 [Pseudomonas sp. MPR-ANC1]